MREAAKELAETEKRQGAQDDRKQWIRAEAVAALLTLCRGNVHRGAHPASARGGRGCRCGGRRGHG